MKKIAAILLLFVFIFNFVGYKLLVAYKVANAKYNLEAAIDKNDFDNKDLIVIKKPTNLPYYNNTNSYSRAYGEVEFNGITYHYVKTRIYNDTIELLCIPNAEKQILLQNTKEFAKANLDIRNNPTDNSTSKSLNITIKKEITEFEENLTLNLSINRPFLSFSFASHTFNNLGHLHKLSVAQPPDFI